MKRRNGIVALFVAAACAAGFVTAAPATAAPQATDIGYSAEIVDGNKVVLTTDIGSLRTSGDQLEIVDANGKVAASLPLLFNLEDKQFPILADVSGRNATLTPVVDPAAGSKVNVSDSVRKQVAGPATRQERDTQALQTLGTYVSVSVAVGGLIGTIVGATVGCVIGAVIGAAVGCFPGLVSGAGIGSILGTIAVGGPTLVGAVIQYFETINSPFVPAKN